MIEPWVWAPERVSKNSHSLFHWRDGRAIVEMAGEINGSAAAEVCYRIELLGLRECTLDFSQVKVIELFGSRVLACGLKSLRKNGILFELDGLPESVAETLCLGGVIEALV